jgi:hypothetical protein
MLPPAADRPKLIAVLTQLGSAVEELFLSGMTTASEATRQTLNAALQEAARFRLLRLGSTLRTAMEELGRFTSQDPLFSRRRLTFFLSRAWLLGRGLGHALLTSDEKEYDRLTWSPPTQPLPRAEVVCLGVTKKVAAGAFVAFEFRFRAVSNAPPVTAGQCLSWSAVFPIQNKTDIPPEGYLQLPQKQKFTPSIFLEKKTIIVANANLSTDESGNGRISLGIQSTAVLGDTFTDWERFLNWSSVSALERIRNANPGPLDLDTELQEEVVLRNYVIGPPCEGEHVGQTLYPVRMGNLELMAHVGAEVEGKSLKQKIEEIRKSKDVPPLFGLMHYERCRLQLQPLSIFKPGPDYLTISTENVGNKAVLKTLKFN